MAVATRPPTRVALLAEGFIAAVTTPFRESEMCRRCRRRVRVMAFRGTGYCCGRCQAAAK